MMATRRQPLQLAAQLRLLHARGCSTAKSSTTSSGTRLVRGEEGPGLKDFIAASAVDSLQECEASAAEEEVPYLQKRDTSALGRKVYFETYGCQMNVNDTEIAWSVLKNAGYTMSKDEQNADVILAVTCAIREKAEQKIWTRLDHFKRLKQSRPRELPPLKVGVLGCMAERLKTKLLETDKMVDLVAGPDSYRDLPKLLSLTESGQAAVNVMLSLDETYADIMPVRIKQSSPSAFVSIMRGCDNMCSFCIVPFTRGRERSRPMDSIVEEVKMLSEKGVKEVILLGQNVNSYRDIATAPSSPDDGTGTHTVASTDDLSRGFKTIYHKKEGGRRFAELLDRVSRVDPEMRVRFTSPHPKDFPDELLHLIRERSNVCKQIHLPVQSGNSVVLERMRRGYTRESYLELVDHIRSILPEVTLSSDFIVGFCGETEEQHRDTVSLMKAVQFDIAYMFAYSMRKKTHAYHRMEDDVPEEEKRRRLLEVNQTYQSIVDERNKRFVGTDQLLLVEGESKKSADNLLGRTDGYTKVVFPNKSVPCGETGPEEFRPGDYVHVKITEAIPGSRMLRGLPISKTTLSDFYRTTLHGKCL